MKLVADCRPHVPVIDPETNEPTGEFVTPDGEPIVEGVFEPTQNDILAPRPPSPDEVDRERDRRTEWLFTFNGVQFRLDEKSLTRITAMGADARFAIAGGAQAGSLRWADPDNDFGFIATDNSVMPMDAPTMVAFSVAAKLWVARHTFAGRAIKDMDPIPSDFSADQYWPEVG